MARTRQQKNILTQAWSLCQEYTEALCQAGLPRDFEQNSLDEDTARWIVHTVNIHLTYAAAAESAKLQPAQEGDFNHEPVAGGQPTVFGNPTWKLFYALSSSVRNIEGAIQELWLLETDDNGVVRPMEATDTVKVMGSEGELERVGLELGMFPFIEDQRVCRYSVQTGQSYNVWVGDKHAVVACGSNPPPDQLLQRLAHYTESAR